MNDQNDALLARFRANLRARVQRIRDMLDILRQIPNNEEATSQVLGELHTLKGETRLLGLTQHSELARTLETLLQRVDGETIAQADTNLEVMARSLTEQVTRDDSEAMIATMLRRLEGGCMTSVRSAPLASKVSAAAAPACESANPVALGLRHVPVDAQLINELCAMMVGVTSDFGRILAQANQLVAATRDTHGVVHQLSARLAEECSRYHATVESAATHTRGLRMVPIQPLMLVLADFAQQLAASVGKAIRVSVEAHEATLELDAQVKIWDAIIHLVRASVHYGLEFAAERGAKGPIGNLTLRARGRDTSMTFVVEDDGRGIDANRVRGAAIARRLIDEKQAESMSDDAVMQLVFEGVLSSGDKVDSPSGGRLGLDGVKARAESLGGSVEVRSKTGLGTRFSITLPLAMNTEPMIVFEVAGDLYGLPTKSVHAVVGWRDLATNTADSDSIILNEGQPTLLRSFAELLGREMEPCSAAVVVALQAQRCALLVAQVIGERELIRRPLDAALASEGVIEGSTTLEDGRDVLLLDLARIEQGVQQVNDRNNDMAVPNQLTVDAGARVLLVDDSPIIRDMVTEILVSAGLNITAAANGEEALEKIADAEPDLVLSDIEMPHMDGFSLLEQIRKRTQRLPVVMLTTRASVQDRQRASNLGANAYVLKDDFRSAVLLDVIQRFVPIHR